MASRWLVGWTSGGGDWIIVVVRVGVGWLDGGMVGRWLVGWTSGSGGWIIVG